MRTIAELTGLRFVAAFYVFIFHLYSYGLLPGISGPLGRIVQQGALGVNIFFILSGYVLTHSQLRSKDAQLSTYRAKLIFMAKRLARIYPAYLVGLLAYVAIRANVGELTPYHAVIALLNAALVQTLNPHWAMDWYGSMSWSISVEFFFYLAFPLVLPLLHRLGQRTLLLTLVVVYLTSFIPGLLYNLAGRPFTGFLLTYTFPLLRLPEFLTGIIICLLVQQHGWRVPEWLAAALVLLTGCYLAIAGRLLDGYVVQNVLVLPTIAVLIATLVSTPTRLFAWLGTTPIVLLGESSYCFYIVQIPLMLLLHNWLQTHPQAVGNGWYGLLIFVMNLVGGYVLHRFIEKPSHQFLMQQVNQKLVTSIITG